MNKKIHVLSSLTGKRNSPVPSPILNRYVNTTRTLLSVFIGFALPLTTQNSLFTIPAGVAMLAAGYRLGATTFRRCDYRSGLFFYPYGMTFERLFADFADWFSENVTAAMLVGIRSDESYQRFAAIASSHSCALPTINHGPR